MQKIAVFTYHSPHFCFPWRRPCDYHAIFCMDGKTIQCLPKTSQHLPIFVCACCLIWTLFLHSQIVRSLRGANTVLYYRQVPVLFLLTGPKNGFFAPQGRHVAPINAKVGRSASPCQLSLLSGQKCGNTAPKTVIISNFGHKFVPRATRLQYFYEILSVCTRL